MRNLLEKIFRKRPVARERRFNAAKQDRLLRWTVGMDRINGQLKQDYVLMVRRARDLAENNDLVSGYLENLERNVIGPDGFRLQPLARDASGGRMRPGRLKSGNCGSFSRVRSSVSYRQTGGRAAGSSTRWC